MSSPRQTPILDTSTSQFDRVIDAVIERGYDDIRENADDYSVLIRSFEFRSLVTFQLYDSYFPPKRHEFELRLLSHLVDAIATKPPIAFLGGAVAGGVVGNAAYDVLKQLLSHVVSKLRPIKRSHSCFKEIEKNVDVLMKFFEHRNQAGIKEISDALDTEPDKIEPLLKLLGFRCRRKGKRRVWMIPYTGRSGRPKRRQ